MTDTPDVIVDEIRGICTTVTDLEIDLDNASDIIEEWEAAAKAFFDGELLGTNIDTSDPTAVFDYIARALEGAREEAVDG